MKVEIDKTDHMRLKIEMNLWLCIRLKMKASIFKFDKSIFLHNVKEFMTRIMIRMNIIPVCIGPGSIEVLAQKITPRIYIYIFDRFKYLYLKWK